ncbi:MAG TPA: choice-of-anchor tandem repeat GloVer-containing protein [Terriglobales bacterium]|nr:choice-of-anchor tandem repeat GloVer-containing protein [Terriglobales bacterium]
MSCFSKTFSRIALFPLAVVLLVGISFGQATETVLYSFGGYVGDALGPVGGLVFDAAGNIYGTTISGGPISGCPGDSGCGTVFELSPSSNGWIETILYNFCTNGNQYTCPDGAEPWDGLIFDKSGNLYGTTYMGGTGYGTVFELSPPSIPGSAWTETVLWTFGGEPDDGAFPYYGKLNWDASGNLFGMTVSGGTYDHGTVFELSPQPGGAWKESILHNFDRSDGAEPMFGVAIDGSGNLYGAAEGGGRADGCKLGCGVVYELSPAGEGSWSYSTLFQFTFSGGAYPTTPISIDNAGNLYGTLEYGGRSACSEGCGGIFKLARNTGGEIKKYTLFFNGQNGANPASGVLLDGRSGIAFGTTLFGNNVYRTNGQTIQTLYRFCSLPGCADGSSPEGGILQGRSGELYGVTEQGGSYGGGVVFSISQ